MKQYDFINQNLRQKNEAKAYINKQWLDTIEYLPNE